MGGTERRRSYKAKTMRCDKAPPGWFCTRDAGHEGPCAAVEETTQRERSSIEDRLERIVFDLHKASAGGKNPELAQAAELCDTALALLRVWVSKFVV
jgi:hypothetical protein